MSFTNEKADISYQIILRLTYAATSLPKDFIDAAIFCELDHFSESESIHDLKKRTQRHVPI